MLSYYTFLLHFPTHPALITLALINPAPEPVPLGGPPAYAPRPSLPPPSREGTGNARDAAAETAGRPLLIGMLVYMQTVH